MTHEDITWILVSDASRARLFTLKGKEPLALVQEFAHPESRAKNRDLASDRPGRVQQAAAASRSNLPGGAGKGSSSAMEPDTPPKEVEAAAFARSLAELLDKGLSSTTHARLVLVAPPHFLGLLRAQLSDPVSRRVSASLDKDFTQVPIHELKGRLAEVL